MVVEVEGSVLSFDVCISVEGIVTSPAVVVCSVGALVKVVRNSSIVDNFAVGATSAVVDVSGGDADLPWVGNVDDIVILVVGNCLDEIDVTGKVVGEDVDEGTVDVDDVSGTFVDEDIKAGVVNAPMGTTGFGHP